MTDVAWKENDAYAVAIEQAVESQRLKVETFTEKSKYVAKVYVGSGMDEREFKFDSYERKYLTLDVLAFLDQLSD